MGKGKEKGGEFIVRKDIVAIIAFATASLMLGPALAQTPAMDAAAGKSIAERLCSNCHVSERDGKPPARADVPSFHAIANLPTTTPERLAGAIIIPHPAMPNVSLTREEIRDVIAYIMSLRQ